LVVPATLHHNVLGFAIQVYLASASVNVFFLFEPASSEKFNYELQCAFCFAVSVPDSSYMRFVSDVEVRNSENKIVCG
jgi:hypothetical protein